MCIEVMCLVETIIFLIINLKVLATGMSRKYEKKKDMFS